MTKIKKSWDILGDDQRREAIDRMISFFRSERSEEIGVLAAENILDMFLQDLGVQLYNKGIDDTKDFIKKWQEDLALDIEVNLKK
jgi:uncharacterized protein (DUF2164 family)